MSTLPEDLKSKALETPNIPAAVVCPNQESILSAVIEGKNIDIFDSDWSINDFVKICEPIDNTKLFWALLRCQKINPENRFLLWI